MFPGVAKPQEYEPQKHIFWKIQTTDKDKPSPIDLVT